jgi:phage gp16-like protein
VVSGLVLGIIFGGWKRLSKTGFGARPARGPHDSPARWRMNSASSQAGSTSWISELPGDRARRAAMAVANGHLLLVRLEDVIAGASEPRR